MIKSNSLPPVWLLLEAIDSALDQNLTLTEKVQQINHVISRALCVDAIWCMTFDPLPQVACGLVQTPLSVDPNAAVTLVDRFPGLAPNTLLSQAISAKKSAFETAQRTLAGQIDGGMADALFSSFDINPFAFIPLTHGGRVWGGFVLGMRSGSVDSIPADMQALLPYLEHHLGRSFHFLHQQATTRRHTNALIMLNQVAQTITSRLDIDAIIQQTMAGINRLLDVEAGSLLLLDDLTGELYFKITLRGEHRAITSYRLDPGEGIAGWVVRQNRPAIVRNADADPRFSPKIDQAIGFRTRSILCAPLNVRGRSIGVLELVNKRGEAFTVDDQDLLVSVCAALGIALQNADLYEVTRQRARRNEAVNQVAAAISAQHGLAETTKSIFDQLNRLFEFDQIHVTLLDSESNMVRQWSFGGNGSPQLSEYRTPLENSPLARFIQSEDAALAHASADATIPILTSNGQNFEITIPLKTEIEPFGSLTLSSQKSSAFEAQDLSLLQQLTPHIAVVIEKALLLDSAEQRARQLHLMNRFSEMLVSTKELQAIVDIIISVLPRILPADVHGVIIEGDEGTFLALAHPQDFRKSKQVLDDFLKIFGELRKPAEMSSISKKLIAANPPVVEEWQPVTTTSMPILTRQGTAGAIYTCTNRSERPSDEFLHIFSLVVSQISAAVENARLFQQVERERARLAAILASSTDAVLVVDRQQQIVLANPAALEILGVADPRQGQLLHELTSLKPLVQLFEAAMQGGNTTGEIPLPDGRTFYANLSTVSVADAEIIGWVATMQDVSHFKELNQLKNEFVGQVSHDLRAPLSGILIASELVAQAGEINTRQQDLIDLVGHRVRSMSELIEDLLDVGQIEAGINMELTACRLDDLVTEVVQAVQPQAAKKQIQLTLGTVGGPQLVLANPMRLRQAIHNLVGNAVKYTLAGGVVSIKLYPHETEMWLQVTDTGVGIAASDQPHIFEKFYRAKGDHMIGIEGTGLGLSIVQSIVAKHGGRIWLESVFGEGSTFTVALPLVSPATISD